MHQQQHTMASLFNFVSMHKCKQSDQNIKIMAIKVEMRDKPLHFHQPRTDHSMSSAATRDGKRPRRQTMGAASRLPRSTSTTNVTSRFRLPTPSALPRSVSFFTNFSKSANTKPSTDVSSKALSQEQPPSIHPSLSGWPPRESMSERPARTAIPIQKKEPRKEPSMPIPQRGLMSQVQPLPTLPPKTTTYTHHRDESIENINEVSCAKSKAYWLGRYVAVSDKLRNAALPDMQTARAISPLPSFQIVRSVSTSTNPDERTYPPRSSSKANGCDHLHAMHDQDQRERRVFALLREYCITDAARDSLANFVDALADAKIAKGDEKVGTLRGIGKGLRSDFVIREKKGWLDGLKGKKRIV